MDKVDVMYDCLALLEKHKRETNLPEFFQKLPWDELSKYNGWIDPFLIIRYADFWDSKFLSQNKNVEWSASVIESLGRKLFGYIEDKDTLDINFYLEFFKNEQHIPFKIKENLSCRKDIGMYAVINYPQFFALGNNAKSYTQTVLNRYNYIFDKCRSISSNPIRYSSGVEFLRKYKNELDFWSIALYGKLNSAIIKEFAANFDIVRPYKQESIKHSDWGRYKIYYFRSGWENLLTNPHTPLDYNFFEEFGNRRIKKLDPLDGWHTDVSSYTDGDLQDFVEKAIKSDSDWIKVKDLDAERLISERSYFGIQIA